MDTKERILLLRPDRAGDALKTLPVLRQLRLRFPQAEFHLLASEHNASLFAFEPGYSIHVLPKQWKRMKIEKLKHFFVSMGGDRFTKAVNLLCDPSDGMALLFSAIPADSKYSTSLEPIEGVIPLTLPEETPAHRNETENIAILITQALDADLRSRLEETPGAPILSDTDRAEADEKMGPKRGLWLGFCPMASHKTRVHPVKRWQKLLQRVTAQEEFEKFFLFGTPSDYRHLEKLREVVNAPERVELCFPSTFRTLGAYLERLDGVIAVDSGPLHLARSLGVKSLGILSGGDTERWFPNLKEGERILRRGIFNRFPTSFEIVWAYDKWSPEVIQQANHSRELNLATGQV